MTLEELKTKANARLVTLWSEIQTREDNYFIKHGQYFGLRWSPSAPVIDGLDTQLTIELPSRAIHQEDVSFSAVDLPFQLSIERLVQSSPRDTALWLDKEQPKPEPVWGATEETYRAWIRVQLPNDDVWMRSRERDGNDSGWFKFEPKI